MKESSRCLQDLCFGNSIRSAEVRLYIVVLKYYERRTFVFNVKRVYVKK